MAQEDRDLADAERNALSILEMVRVLHERGYELLRICPGMSSSGMHWRCSMTHRDNTQPDHGAMTLVWDSAIHYTTADRTEYFGWDDASDDSKEELAEKFEQRFPDLIASTAGRDPEYVAWYVEMLGMARRGIFPIAYADWYDDPDPRWLPTTEGFKSGLPMPPR